MTITIKQEQINGFYIAVELSKFEPLYKVSICERFDIGLCGYPIAENFYTDKAKALRRFRDLKKKAIEGVM